MSQPRTQTAVHTTSIPIPAIFLGTTQVVSVGGTSAATSNAFSSGLVRVAVSTACYVAFGDTPTATTSSAFMPAGSVEYFAVEPGQKAAFIQLSSSGIATVTEAAELVG